MELLLLIPIVAITAFVTAKIVRRTARSESRPADASARFEELERTVDRLQQELSETQERLDFAERMLTQAREERRLGS
ncbi:MAG TPA: hypothetical protein VGJ83_00695 [Gemmatimonadales bacterium]|jgi:type II secretory pathway component PulJ